MSNQAVSQAVYLAVERAVNWAVYRGVYWDVDRAVKRAVAARGTVAARGAVDGAVYADSPHPALKLYLRGWRDE